VSDPDHPVSAPPAGEELHLPGPSLLPFLCAIAITLIVVGTTISVVLSIIGVVMLVILVIRWVGDTRRDVGELPESHH
jgi:Flp pilus assembly protein TadB